MYDIFHYTMGLILDRVLSRKQQPTRSTTSLYQLQIKTLQSTFLSIIPRQLGHDISICFLDISDII